MSFERVTIGDATLYLGDCSEVMPSLDLVSAIVTDPPYGLEFMGKEWDKLGITKASPVPKPGNRGGFADGNKPSFERVKKHLPAMQEWHHSWAVHALQALRPAGYMLVMGGTRTYHRLACAVEDAGFEIRDCLMWIYGSGFPKAKSCLKPAYEPILLCRKPGPRVEELGIDECRVPLNGDYKCGANGRPSQTGLGDFYDPEKANQHSDIGRWPANIVHDGSEEVVDAFATFGERNCHDKPRPDIGTRPGGFGNIGTASGDGKPAGRIIGDTGTAARFFYTAKASKSERGDGNTHPTVKPLALMKWLVQLVCPLGETVLDPFMGSGTTGVACLQTGRKFIGIEIDRGYFDIACERIRHANGETGLFAPVATAADLFAESRP